jgi:hypothetical protein
MRAWRLGTANSGVPQKTSFMGEGTAFLRGKRKDKRRSRFPEGMTERKARARATATATARATATTAVLHCVQDDGV